MEWKAEESQAWETFLTVCRYFKFANISRGYWFLLRIAAPVVMLHICLANDAAKVHASSSLKTFSHWRWRR